MSAVLHLEGFIDIALVSRNAGHNRNKAITSRVVSWDSVKHGSIASLDKEAPLTKQPASNVPLRIASASSEPPTKVSGNSKMSNIKSILVGMSLSALASGPPPSTSISADSTVASKISRHLTSSVGFTTEQQRCTIQLPNALTASYLTKYIQSYKNQTSNASYAQVTSKKSDISSLLKHANVVTSGETSSSIILKNEAMTAADHKVLYEHLLGIVNTLIATKVSMALVLWDVRHVDIIKKYPKFIDTCANCKCMCSFTTNIDNQISVEIIGLSLNSLEHVQAFVQSLLPRQDNWSHKSGIQKSLQYQIDDICSQYAMTVQVIDTSTPATTKHTYRMWGFNELFDSGKQKIQVGVLRFSYLSIHLLTA